MAKWQSRTEGTSKESNKYSSYTFYIIRDFRFASQVQIPVTSGVRSG